MNIFVTGAAGFIGSTFVYESLKKGLMVIGCDNFSNSNKTIIKKISDKFQNFLFFNMDIRDRDALNTIFLNHKVDCVVHFAALKSVFESELNKDLYWNNNVEGTEALLNSMDLNEIDRIIYSSSAAVYGATNNIPMDERSKLNPLNQYGKTKQRCEELIKEWSRDSNRSIILRYFNPGGSHEDMCCYENPLTSQGNIISEVLKVVLGVKKIFQIFGDDYNTKDGTCERDYLHISDLIEGHFLSLDYLENVSGFEIFNLGAGKAISVMGLLNQFKKTNNLAFPINISARRDGDMDICYADCTKSNKYLGWKCKKSFRDICKTAYEVIDRNRDEIK